MAQYAAFLRGMNVGGRRLTNADLRVLFAGMGFDDPACFRASGNVVFVSDREPVAAMQRRIEETLAASLGYAVPVFLRDRQQVLAIAALSPFPDAALSAGGKPQVAMLAEPLSRAARRELTERAGDSDLLAFGPLELHWLPRAGVLDSALDMLSIEALTGPMTMRTLRTVRELAGKHLSV
jgi:uncharacterized protein (DUF1697 family)